MKRKLFQNGKVYKASKMATKRKLLFYLVSTIIKLKVGNKSTWKDIFKGCQQCYWQDGFRVEVYSKNVLAVVVNWKVTIIKIY